MNPKPGAHLPGGPIHGWQLGAVFLPFLLTLLYAVQPLAGVSAIPWLAAALVFAFLGLLVGVSLVGLVRGFPVWALPALGNGALLRQRFPPACHAGSDLLGRPASRVWRLAELSGRQDPDYAAGAVGIPGRHGGRDSLPAADHPELPHAGPAGVDAAVVPAVRDGQSYRSSGTTSSTGWKGTKLPAWWVWPSGLGCI